MNETKGQNLRPDQQFTQAMKDRLAMRLLMRPDRRDTGEELPKTAAAWALPDGTPELAAERTRQLVRALGEERLIVPVSVEADPDDPDHKPLDPAASPLKTADSPYGNSVVGFTSAEELKRWDSNGRPMTIKTYRVAVGALTGHGSGTITLNPGSGRRTLIPRPAVLALASGDSWLPAWEDRELRDELTALAKEECPGIVGIGLRPGAAYGAASWDGGVAVDIAFDMGAMIGAAGGNESKARAMFAGMMKRVSENSRLREAAQQVELVPRPVATS